MVITCDFIWHDARKWTFDSCLQATHSQVIARAKAIFPFSILLHVCEDLVGRRLEAKYVVQSL